MLQNIGFQVVVMRVEQFSSYLCRVGQGSGLAFDAILIPTMEIAVGLRACDKLSLILLVMMISGLSLSRKAAAVGIMSCIKMSCRPIDLWNGILPTLGNRIVHATSGFTPPLSILLAEDNDVNVKVAVLTLEKYKHIVTVVEDRQQALDAAKRHQNDMILMDVQMPVVDGFDSTTNIRQWERFKSFRAHPSSPSLCMRCLEIARSALRLAWMITCLNRSIKI